MSVAFRRESDEEHLEPKFEIPIPPGPNLVTARGLALIRGRVSDITGQLEKLSDENAICAIGRPGKSLLNLSRFPAARRCKSAPSLRFYTMESGAA